MNVCMKDAVLSADTSESTSRPETQSSKNICAKTWTTEGKLKIWWTHDKEGKQTRREGKREEKQLLKTLKTRVFPRKI